VLHESFSRLNLGDKCAIWGEGMLNDESAAAGPEMEAFDRDFRSCFVGLAGRPYWKIRWPLESNVAITEGLFTSTEVLTVCMSALGELISYCLCSYCLCSCDFVSTSTGRFSLFALLSAFFRIELRIEPLSRLMEPRSARGRVGVSIFGLGCGCGQVHDQDESCSSGCWLCHQACIIYNSMH
jgi:hypothetical protein